MITKFSIFYVLEAVFPPRNRVLSSKSILVLFWYSFVPFLKITICLIHISFISMRSEDLSTYSITLIYMNGSGSRILSRYLYAVSLTHSMKIQRNSTSWYHRPLTRMTVFNNVAVTVIFPFPLEVPLTHLSNTKTWNIPQSIKSSGIQCRSCQLSCSK